MFVRGLWLWPRLLCGGVFFLLVVALLVMVGIMLLRALAGPGDQGPGPSSMGPAGQMGPRAERALDIVRERYARGEISKEQFEQMRRDISV